MNATTTGGNQAIADRREQSPRTAEELRLLATASRRATYPDIPQMEQDAYVGEWLLSYHSWLVRELM